MGAQGYIIDTYKTSREGAAKDFMRYTSWVEELITERLRTPEENLALLQDAQWI